MDEMFEKPAVIVVGDSHIEAIRKAHNKRSETSSAYSDLEVHVLRRHRIKLGRAIGTDLGKISDVVARAKPDDIVAISPGGNTHSRFSIIRRSPPFDYYIPGTSASPDEQIIPYQAVYDYFMETLTEEFSQYKTIKKIRDGNRLYRICPPPPARSNEYIAENADGYYHNRGIQLGVINDPFFRLKAWKMEVIAIRKQCELRKLKLIMPPQDCLDSDGFLKEQFYGDATHANVTYGDRVLQQLIKLLPNAGRPAAPSHSAADT